MLMKLTDEELKVCSNIAEEMHIFILHFLLLLFIYLKGQDKKKFLLKILFEKKKKRRFVFF